jgi:uroporphyrinogen decarboxylase
VTKLEQVLATLRHRAPGVIPQQEVFMDDTAQAKFTPILQERMRRRGIELPTDERLALPLEAAELLDNSMVSVGGGGLRNKVIERGDNYHILEWENGCRWRIREQPYNRQYIDMPIKREADLDTVPLPDLRDPARYEGVEEGVRYFTERGYVAMAGVGGAFSGVWYLFRSYEDLMMDMATNPDFAERLIGKVADLNLAAAEELLKRGVRCLAFGDDMGTSASTFFSLAFYDRFFFPHHKRLCDLTHRYGAFTNFHSHGNINTLMPRLVEAEVDILNPVGPTDNMNLAELKQRYGARMTFLGGMSKWIGEMTRDELVCHVDEVVRTGSRGGGYMAACEGGIPYTMTPETAVFYLDTLAACRRKYGGG